MPTKAGGRTASSVRPFSFGDELIAPGTRRDIEVRLARLAPGTWATMPVVILHGARPGPTVWLSGALHGDELNGVEIIRRLIRRIGPRDLAGTIIAVPIVNVFGVMIESRYLPDRRDLNRSFPGSPRGSLAARTAHLFFSRIVSCCRLGLDFHTGSDGRSNLPQVRCDLSDDETRRYATAFGAPIMIHAALRDGSLRAAARAHGIRVLLFEGGEAGRFDDSAITTGVDGALRVLREAGMIADAPPPAASIPLTAWSSRWTRATRSGFCHHEVALGQRVEPGQIVAVISDSIGREESRVRARDGGLVIGLRRTALVHRGDAVAHIAEIVE